MCTESACWLIFRPNRSVSVVCFFFIFGLELKQSHLIMRIKGDMRGKPKIVNEHKTLDREKWRIGSESLGRRVLSYIISKVLKFRILKSRCFTEHFPIYFELLPFLFYVQPTESKLGIVYSQFHSNTPTGTDEQTSSPV